MTGYRQEKSRGVQRSRLISREIQMKQTLRSDPQAVVGDTCDAGTGFQRKRPGVQMWCSY